METEKIYLVRVAAFLLGVLSLVALVGLFYLAKNYKYVGNNQQKTITVVGNAKVSTKPDISSISFTIRYTGKTSKEAETKVAKDLSDAKTKILALGVEEKDIKTNSYQSYPKYNYPNITCVRYPCPSSEPVLEGYETSQTVEVKVRNLEKVGDVLSAITSSKINEVSGPNFVVEDMEKVKAEARGLAIEDAKNKAELLAKQLGVDLGDITYFADNQNVGIYNYGMGGDTMMMKAESVSAVAPTPDLPAGEQELNYTVSITYEID